MKLYSLATLACLFSPFAIYFLPYNVNVKRNFSAIHQPYTHTLSKEIFQRKIGKFPEKRLQRVKVNQHTHTLYICMYTYLNIYMYIYVCTYICSNSNRKHIFLALYLIPILCKSTGRTLISTIKENITQHHIR